MSKEQLSIIGIFTILFAVLYFGFDTKPSEFELLEKSRALNMSSTDISILRKEAFDEIGKSERGRIELLMAQLNNAIDTVDRIETLKSLSGAWFEFGRYAIAGHYAELVAEINESDETWGITGTTYAFGIGKSITDKENKFCFEGAINAFDNAISLNPSVIRHQVNKAITFIEHPLPDNPMKGIQLLLDLNNNEPDNVLVLNQLAKFGIQTNQLEKAETRLKKALTLHPENAESNCLMADLLERRNEKSAAKVYRDKCLQLTNEDN